MKPGSYFINLTAGRTAMDESAVAKAIREGWLAGAALNMLAGSPLESESELWQLPNVIISPGLAGDDPGKWVLQRDLFVENLARFVKGEDVKNEVNKELGY